jgi:hypothetical protein
MKFIGIASLVFAVMTVTGAANADPVKLTGVQMDKATKATAGQVQRPGHLVLTDTQMDKIIAGLRNRGLDDLVRGLNLTQIQEELTSNTRASKF